MNRVSLLGRLVRDPEIKYTTNGKVVAQFTLAVPRPTSPAPGKDRETDFINCVLWDKTAEALGNHVTKGQRIIIEGRLQVRNYEDKNKNKRYVTEVIGERIDFIEVKSQGKPTGSNDVGDWGAMGDDIPADF